MNSPDYKLPLATWWLVKITVPANPAHFKNGDQRVFVVGRDPDRNMWAEVELFRAVDETFDALAYGEQDGVPNSTSTAFGPRVKGKPFDRPRRTLLVSLGHVHTQGNQLAREIVRRLSTGYGVPEESVRQVLPAVEMPLPSDEVRKGVWRNMWESRSARFPEKTPAGDLGAFEEWLEHNPKAAAAGVAAIVFRLVTEDEPLLVDDLLDEWGLETEEFERWLMILERVPGLADGLEAENGKIWYVAPSSEGEIDAAELNRLYWDEGMTLAELGEQFGYTSGGMRHVFNRLGIPRRGRGRPKKKTTEEE